MSAISNSLPSPQAQFQAIQSSKSSAPESSLSPSLKAQAAATPLAKPTESLKTKNNDGTYGPKHTLLPPGVYHKENLNGAISESADAVSTVNVKI